MKHFLFFTVWVFLLISCQSDPPVIDQAAWYLEYASLPDSGEEFVYLHITAAVEEPQGFGDITEIRLAAPGELFWDIDVTQIPHHQEGRVITLATGRLKPPPGEEGFPAGTYRLTVTDIPGSSDTKELFLPRSSRAYRSSSPPDASQVWMYDRTGNLIDSFSLDDEPLEELLERINPEFYMLIAEDPDHPLIFSHGPVYP